MGDFHRLSRSPSGLSHFCKACQAEYTATWQRKNPTKRPEYNRRTHLKAKYGLLTNEHYEALMAKQGGRCALCRAEKCWRWEILSIDHDHDTGALRGLLCHSCNLMLGYAKDDPDVLERAAAYLRAHGPK